MTERSTLDLYETIQADMRDIILRHLKTSAVSVSSHAAKRTGNAYQAIRLGDQVMPGFRSAQRNVFTGVDLRGKSVLDLGSNLGEVARDAARAGAASVLGIEYDKYFVQMARLIAAHDDLSNIGFKRGDLTMPETYSGRYDVVVALSVFTYVKDHVDKLAAMTNELLILETHAVKENWHKHYIKLLSRHFPYIALVGVSDHRASSKSEWRYLLFCGHKPLDGILAARARNLAGTEGLLTLDMSRSTVPHLDKIFDVIGVRPGNFEEVLEAATAYLRARPAEEVYDQIAKSGLVTAPLYWCHFLSGYNEYRKVGRLDQRNTYYRLIAQLVDRGLYDGALRQSLKQRDGGIRRLALRYEMADALVSRGDEGASLDPVILYDILSPENFPTRGPAFQMFITEFGEAVFPLALDGHHRTFVAYSAGSKRLPAVPIWYEHLKSVAAFMKRSPSSRQALWTSVYSFSEKLGARAGSTEALAQRVAAGE